MSSKIPIKIRGGQKRTIKIRYFGVAFAVLGGVFVPKLNTSAANCPDVKIIFARGSGGELNTDKNYVEFKNTIESKLTTTDLKYEFLDLDYPATSVGFSNLQDVQTTVGAFLGGGEAYEFGKSVQSGASNLYGAVNDASCPNTKYVLGGYSQGAMVISKALRSISPDRIIYAATFGDPKLYLPEGEGLIPAACRGDNLSDYRMYVPDCRAYKGLLGAYVPYEQEGYAGKLGVWCNKRDIFCSSHASIGDHIGYVSDGLYEDASRVIFDKICKAFVIKNSISSPHDTAILIDSTASMEKLIEKYKSEALRLAQETLDAGGRVALYDYRDLNDPYEPVQRCNFETCTLERFTNELHNIKVGGGGDLPESLLSGSLHVMQELNWKQGSTKSLVILTDGDFLSPDRDGVSFDEVVRLSKEIDPVNFYIITADEHRESYAKLATATDGKVVTQTDELHLLLDYIMERYDSLPRAEEIEPEGEKPALEVLEALPDGPGQVKVRFKTNGEQVVVQLNDAILGVIATDEDGFGEALIGDLGRAMKYGLYLTPIRDDLKGDAVLIGLPNVSTSENKPVDDDSAQTGFGGTENGASTEQIVLKAPNTGRL